MQRFIRGEWNGTGQYPFWMTHNSKERGAGEGPWGVKKQNISWGSMLRNPNHLHPRSVRLGRSFRKSVSIYPTSALRNLNQGPLVMVQCQENLWILNFFSLVSPNRCSSALKESFYNLQYSECKENLKF